MVKKKKSVKKKSAKKKKPSRIKKDFDVFRGGVRKLKALERKLNSLNTKGFEKDVKRIRPKLKKVILIPSVEEEIRTLEMKIAKRDVKKRIVEPKVRSTKNKLSSEILKAEDKIRDNEMVTNALIRQTIKLKSDLKKNKGKVSKPVLKKLDSLIKKANQRKIVVRKISKKIDTLSIKSKKDKKALDRRIISKLDSLNKKNRAIQRKLEKRLMENVSSLEGAKQKAKEHELLIKRLVLDAYNLQDTLKESKKKLDQEISVSSKELRKKSSKDKKKISASLKKNLSEEVEDLKKSVRKNQDSKIRKIRDELASSKKILNDTEKINKQIVLELINLKKKVGGERGKKIVIENKGEGEKFLVNLKKLEEKIENNKNKLDKKLSQDMILLREIINENKNKTYKDLHKEVMISLDKAKRKVKSPVYIKESSVDLKNDINEYKNKLEDIEKINKMIIIELLNLKDKIEKPLANKMILDMESKLKDNDRFNKQIILELHNLKSRKQPKSEVRIESRDNDLIKAIQARISDNDKINKKIILELLDLRDNVRGKKSNKKLEEIESKLRANDQVSKQIMAEINNLRSRKPQMIVAGNRDEELINQIKSKINENEKVNRQIILELLDLKESDRFNKQVISEIKGSRPKESARKEDPRYIGLIKELEKRIKNHDKINKEIVLEILSLKERLGNKRSSTELFSDLKRLEGKIDKSKEGLDNKISQDMVILRELIEENKRKVFKELRKEIMSNLENLKSTGKTNIVRAGDSSELRNKLKEYEKKFSENEKINKQIIREFLDLRDRFSKVLQAPKSNTKPIVIKQTDPSISKSLREYDIKLKNNEDVNKKIIRELLDLKERVSKTPKVVGKDSKTVVVKEPDPAISNKIREYEKKLKENEKINKKIVSDLLDLRDKFKGRNQAIYKDLHKKFLVKSVKSKKEVDDYKREFYDTMHGELLGEIKALIGKVENDNRAAKERLLKELHDSQKKLQDNEKINNRVISDIIDIKNKVENSNKIIDKEISEKTVVLGKKVDEYKKDIYNELHQQLVGELVDLNKKVDESRQYANQRLIDELMKLNNKIESNKEEITEDLIAKLLSLRKEIERNRDILDQRLEGRSMSLGQRTEQYKKEIYDKLHRQLVGELMELNNKVEENKKDASEKLLMELEKINKRIESSKEEVSEDLIAKMLQLKKRIEENTIHEAVRKKPKLFGKKMTPPKPLPSHIEEKPKLKEPKFDKPKIDLPKLEPMPKPSPLPPIEIAPIKDELMVPDISKDIDDIDIEPEFKIKKITPRKPKTLFLEIEEFNNVKEDLSKVKKSVVRVESSLKEINKIEEDETDEAERLLEELGDIKQNFSKVSIGLFGKLAE